MEPKVEVEVGEKEEHDEDGDRAEGRRIKEGKMEKFEEEIKDEVELEVEECKEKENIIMTTRRSSPDNQCQSRKRRTKQGRMEGDGYDDKNEEEDEQNQKEDQNQRRKSRTEDMTNDLRGMLYEERFKGNTPS